MSTGIPLRWRDAQTGIATIVVMAFRLRDTRTDTRTFATTGLALLAGCPDQYRDNHCGIEEGVGKGLPTYDARFIAHR
jgi:hypothetical protein